MKRQILLIPILASTLFLFDGCSKKIQYVETPRPHLQTWRVEAPTDIKYEVYYVDVKEIE